MMQLIRALIIRNRNQIQHSPRRHFFSMIRIAFALAAALLFAHQFNTPAAAEPAPPTRQQEVEAEETAYRWWLNDWGDNELLCEITAFHDGLPTRLEILEQCGTDRYQQWLDTPHCDAEDTSQCRGSYLHFAGTEQISRTVTIELPTASAHLLLENCSPDSSQYSCHGQPNLIIKGEEPLPNESILSIQGTFAGLSFSCEGEICEVPLRPTPPGGSRLAFWANSSFGDSSEAYTAAVRVTRINQDDQQLTVLSPQLRTPKAPSCAISWQSLPPASELPGWLHEPTEPADLATNHSYAYLAERLVRFGAVSTEACPNLGYTESGTLNACGIEQARPTVQQWQNQFDQEIFAIADERNVPAPLLKALFAKESQFWPGIYFDEAKEAGLGQLTEPGADTTLLWNESFFNEFCPLVLSQSSCSLGYSGLFPGEQELLRGALMQAANASCAECNYGIDLSDATDSVRLFAETLLANCNQVGQMVRNTAEAQPGQVSSYLDLWMLTIANYHGGPGCVANAIEQSWYDHQWISWQSVAKDLDAGCQSAIEYVEDITLTPTAGIE